MSPYIERMKTCKYIYFFEFSNIYIFLNFQIFSFFPQTLTGVKIYTCFLCPFFLHPGSYTKNMLLNLWMYVLSRAKTCEVPWSPHLSLHLSPTPSSLFHSFPCLPFPRLAFPYLALSCLAFRCLVLPCLLLPCLYLPRLFLP